jgi:hypothetical protein
MKAIKTKYHGPGRKLGSRCSAFDGDGHRVYVTWDNGLHRNENYRKAARALCEKMGWSGTLWQGGFGNQEEIFVFQDTFDGPLVVEKPTRGSGK